MFVQEDLRGKNIAEYLLYMWQVEDVIRAAGLDSDRLYETVIKNSGRSESDRLKWKQWYDDLIEMMRVEGKTEHGHLQINENVLMLHVCWIPISSRSTETSTTRLCRSSLSFVPGTMSSRMRSCVTVSICCTEYGCLSCRASL